MSELSREQEIDRIFAGRSMGELSPAEQDRIAELAIHKIAGDFKPQGITIIWGGRIPKAKSTSTRD